MDLDIHVHLQDTYLYKLHVLTNELDRTFADALKKGVDISLSQFLLIAIISDGRTINQRSIAKKLSISPAAIHRQTEIALKRGLVSMSAERKPGRELKLTERGRSKLAESLAVLDKRVFGIFDVSSNQTDLMVHIDSLLNRIRKEPNMAQVIPLARKLYKGDINEAVIAVQLETGVSINPAWWEKNVGNTGTAGEILDRFDKAYAQDFGKRIYIKK